MCNPIIEISNIEENSILKESDKYKQKLIIQNFKDNEVNQIDCVYNLEFLTKYEEIVDVKIIKNGTEINIQNYITDEIVLETSSQHISEYEIEVIYDQSEVLKIRNKLISEGKTKEEIDELIYGIEIKINIKQVSEIN